MNSYKDKTFKTTENNFLSLGNGGRKCVVGAIIGDLSIVKSDWLLILYSLIVNFLSLMKVNVLESKHTLHGLHWQQ